MNTIWYSLIWKNHCVLHTDVCAVSNICFLGPFNTFSFYKCSASTIILWSTFSDRLMDIPLCILHVFHIKTSCIIINIGRCIVHYHTIVIDILKTILNNKMHNIIWIIRHYHTSYEEKNLLMWYGEHFI